MAGGRTEKPTAPATVTGDGTHVAVARGFCGTVIEAGQFVPAGYPIGSWMAEVAKPAPKKAAASEE